MKLTVNGQGHEHRGDGTAAALLDELGAGKTRTALLVNGEVVPAEAWTATPLRENDAIELLVFVGGG